MLFLFIRNCLCTREHQHVHKTWRNMSILNKQTKRTQKKNTENLTAEERNDKHWYENIYAMKAHRASVSSYSSPHRICIFNLALSSRCFCILLWVCFFSPFHSKERWTFLWSGRYDGCWLFFCSYFQVSECTMNRRQKEHILMRKKIFTHCDNWKSILCLPLNMNLLFIFIC